MNSINKLILESLKSDNFINDVYESEWFKSLISKFPLLKIIFNESEELLNNSFKGYLENSKRELSKYEIDWYILTVTYKLVNSVISYCLPTDKVSNVKTSSGKGGSLVVTCDIERDGKSYNFQTEVIIAGGYNIQTAHYRYLVKTNLPKTSNNIEIENSFKEKIKNTDKKSKLEKDLKGYEFSLNREKNQLVKAIENSKLSEDEVEKLARLEEPDTWKIIDVTWDIIKERGADKNYDYDESKFLKSKNEFKESLMVSWKHRFANVKGSENQIKRYENEISKIKDKLAKLD